MKPGRWWWALLAGLTWGCATVPPRLSTSSLDTLTAPRPYAGEIRMRISNESGQASFQGVIVAHPPSNASLLVIDAAGRSLAEYQIIDGAVSTLFRQPGVPALDPASLPSPWWLSLLLTVAGGRLPGPPQGVAEPVPGGYRLRYADPAGMEALVFLDASLAVRRVKGGDGVLLLLTPGKEGFPAKARIETQRGSIELVNLSLEDLDSSVPEPAK